MASIQVTFARNPKRLCHQSERVENSTPVTLAPGYIKYVALFWKGEGGDPYEFKKIGEYRLNDDPPILPGVWTPEGIWVSEGDTLINKFYNSANGIDSIHTSIDIIADFDRLE